MMTERKLNAGPEAYCTVSSAASAKQESAPNAQNRKKEKDTHTATPRTAEEEEQEQEESGHLHASAFAFASAQGKRGRTGWDGMKWNGMGPDRQTG